MKTADAFVGLWWVCPDCGVENNTLVTYLSSGCSCVGCKKCWDYLSLGRSHFVGEFSSTNFEPPVDKMSSSVEWICECDRKNIILPKSVIKKNELENEMMMVVKTVENPKYGLCEDCFAEYELKYPIPEILEKAFKE
jgi:hypothetical protein